MTLSFCLEDGPKRYSKICLVHICKLWFCVSWKWNIQVRDDMIMSENINLDLRTVSEVFVWRGFIITKLGYCKIFCLQGCQI